jgi:hypothetical protein
MIALTFVAAFSIDSWGASQESPSKSKTEQKSNKTGQPDTKAQDSKIGAAPSAAANHGDDKTPAESNQSSKETSEGTEYWVYQGYRVKITDGLLVLFTLGLVIIGIFQAIFLSGTLKATAVAANAADLSAKAAIALELPIINARIHNFGFGISQDTNNSRTEYFSLISFDFNNLGNTRANPMEVIWGWTVGDELPKAPIYTLAESFDIDMVLEADQPATIVEINIGRFEMKLAAGDTDRITNNQTKLWVYCCLIYEDFMQTRREAGFCWKRRETLGAHDFIPDATPAYNRKT